VLGRTDVPIEQQSLELWRAVSGDRGDRLFEDFGSPVLAAAAAVASDARSPVDALRRFDDVVRRERAVGLTLDICRRALVRTVAMGEGGAFGAELFAEAASYYVSRDLPSYLGAVRRVATASDAIALKNGFRDVARNAARSASREGNPPSDPRGWHSYVTRVIDDLRARIRGR
jgi:hypothetical protein